MSVVDPIQVKATAVGVHFIEIEWKSTTAGHVSCELRGATIWRHEFEPNQRLSKFMCRESDVVMSIVTADGTIREYTAKQLVDAAKRSGYTLPSIQDKCGYNPAVEEAAKKEEEARFKEARDAALREEDSAAAVLEGKRIAEITKNLRLMKFAPPPNDSK